MVEEEMSWILNELLLSNHVRSAQFKSRRGPLGPLEQMLTVKGLGVHLMMKMVLVVDGKKVTDVSVTVTLSIFITLKNARMDSAKLDFSGPPASSLWAVSAQEASSLMFAFDSKLSGMAVGSTLNKNDQLLYGEKRKLWNFILNYYSYLSVIVGWSCTRASASSISSSKVSTSGCSIW